MVEGSRLLRFRQGFRVFGTKSGFMAFSPAFQVKFELIKSLG